MRKARGTFWMRAAIFLLAVLFGILTYWAVDFLLDDLRVYRFPDYNAFFADRGDRRLNEQIDALKAQLRELDHQHTLLEQQRGFIRDASSSLKVTVDNLFTLRDRNQDLISREQFERILGTLDRIIDIQEQFKTTAEQYMDITNRKFLLQKELAALEKRLAEQQHALQREYNELLRKQSIRTTILRLLFLLPLGVFATWWLVRKRQSIYRMLYASSAVAIYIRAAVFVHERFPSRYFKYILTVCLLVLVAWGFVWLIRRLVRPKVDVLLKQYREAYERFLCPVCDYPIRIGPRRFLFWTRRTVHKTSLGACSPGTDQEEEPYTCPSCSTRLFEPCSECGKIRHSLLPACRHCGANKTIGTDAF